VYLFGLFVFDVSLQLHMCFLVGQIDAFHMVFDTKRLYRDAREMLIFPAGSMAYS
jgi:hypothetical protein